MKKILRVCLPVSLRWIRSHTAGKATDLIILAAKPSVGKTAFACNLARSAAMNPSKTYVRGILQPEMSSAQLVQRIPAPKSEIWLEKIAGESLKNMNEAALQAGYRQTQAPILSDDCGGPEHF